MPKPSSSHSRLNSSQRSVPKGQEQKLNEIVEAYNTQNFFNGMMQPQASNPTVQNQNGKIMGMLIGSKGVQNNKINSTTRTQKSGKKSNQIQSYSQQFDIQNYSSQEQIQSFSKSSKLSQDSRESLKGKQMGRSGEQRGLSNNQTNDFIKGKSLSHELLTKGKVLLQDKEYSSAINLFTESFKLDNTNMDAKFYKAVSHLDSGSIQESIQEFQELLSISPAHSQLTHILLSIAYKRANDLQNALSVLDQCIGRHPEYPDAYLARGQAYLLSEKFDVALKDF